MALWWSRSPPSRIAANASAWRLPRPLRAQTRSTLRSAVRYGGRAFGSRVRLAACITVGQSLQERDDVVDLRAGQCGIAAGGTIERRLDIDVGVIFRRQVIELAHGAVIVARIPLVRVGVAPA
jgi:hypothetical protein